MLKGSTQNGPKIHDFWQSSGAIVVMLECWGAEERGGDADIRKCPGIRSTFNCLGNKNQRSTERTEISIQSLFYETKVFKNL